ncbi:hypothetical protein [Chromobacterium amazonense]|uniref:hypothetical protein n=1 Tax=Chromobacterium amazonense TaxID=1382803 RepID=UPI003F79A4EE
MSYPHWAPICLMQEMDDPLLSRLVNEHDERGRELWEMLRRQERYSEDTSPRRYALGCLSALMDTDRTSLISPAQYQAHAQKISKATQTLLDLLTWTTGTIGESTEDTATSRAIAYMSPEPFKFLYSNTLLVEAITRRPYSPHPPVVDAPSTPQSILFNAREVAELQRKQLNEEHEERIQAWRKKWGIPTAEEDEDYESKISIAADEDFPMGKELPVTAEFILSSLSRANVLTILEKILHETQMFINHKGSFYLKQPKAVNARIHVFVRHLHEQHMVQFGCPLWDALALATSIILQLPETLSADDIRPIAKGVKK